MTHSVKGHKGRADDAGDPGNPGCLRVIRTPVMG